MFFIWVLILEKKNIIVLRKIWIFEIQQTKDLKLSNFKFLLVLPTGSCKQQSCRVYRFTCFFIKYLKIKSRSYFQAKKKKKSFDIASPQRLWFYFKQVWFQFWNLHRVTQGKAEWCSEQTAHGWKCRAEVLGLQMLSPIRNFCSWKRGLRKMGNTNHSCESIKKLDLLVVERQHRGQTSSII